MRRADGLIETLQLVAIAVAGSDQAGPHRGGVHFRWSEGLEETREIGWEVTPLVRVHPSAVVFHASDRPVVQSLELRSEKEPFRILGVTGRTLAEAYKPPRDPARSS